MTYETIIGLEIHVQLATKSKMFCSCAVEDGAAPNTNVCPICMGHPGTLPVPNAQAIQLGLMAALALGCEIPEYSKFDRKNYFYPDLPKGYQISQYDQPLAKGGTVTIVIDGKEKKIRFNRLHLEEDAAKNTHPEQASYSLVDFNRAGTPLAEIVSEPDLRSPAEARMLLQQLQTLLRYTGASNADMEKGQMRCDANVSTRCVETGESTKISEIKNLNSFRSVERALTYETARQQQIIADKKLAENVKETRGWDDAKGETYGQRNKEEANDYRYFPEPDLPPLHMTVAVVDAARHALPELPDAKRIRFMDEYGLSADDALRLVGDRALAAYYEAVVSELAAWFESEKITPASHRKIYKLASNYILAELLKHLKNNKESVAQLKITPENYAEFIKIVHKGEISSSAAQMVLDVMYQEGKDPSDIIREKDLAQVSDASALAELVAAVIAKNPSVVAEFKGGKANALQFLVGQVMKESKGKANPQLVAGILTEKLQ